MLEYLAWRLGYSNHAEFFEATKGIFGLSESPRLWYLKFKGELENINFRESKFIPCLFMKHVNGKLCGLVTLHVDDAMLTGSPEVQADWEMLRKKLKFGSWTSLHEGGKFLGRWMKQSDDNRQITITMNEYSAALQEVECDASLPDDQPLDAQQLAQLRASVGQLGWLAKQGRPDIAFAVSYLQQNRIDATCSTLRLLNSTIKRAKTPFEVVIRDLQCSLSEIMVLVATDGALAAMPRGKSQLGLMVMLSNPKVQTELAPVVPIEWSSTSCKRVVRSSSAVEAAAASLGYEHAEFLRAVLCEIRDPDFSVRQWSMHVQRCPILLVLDAKVAYDCLSSDELPQDRRTALDIRALREALADPQSASLCRWVPGPQQASDALTKLKGNGVLNDIMASGRWTVVEDETWQKVREQQRINQRAYRARVKVQRKTQQGPVGESKGALESIHGPPLRYRFKFFQQLLTEQHLTVRKTSNKKAKKLASLSAAVDGDDWQNYRTLTGKRAISSKPPYGKTWLKQLFAGQMGLTVLCALAGMSIGVPLDFSSTQWDATTSTGVKAMNQDLLKEDPFCLVITQPCGPWGNWSRFNLAKGGAAAQRTEGRKILKMVNKTVVDRLKMKRHVFLEQPRGSQWLDEPEMADVKALIDSGDLLMFEVDGCCVGYIDFETGLPNLKPSIYVTSMIAAESILSGLKCSRTHQHQPLEGANAFGLRTAQAAEWPTKLNKLVMDLVLQQAAIEFHAPQEIAEVYAGEIRPAEQQGGRQPKKKRTGRIATLQSQFNAPPVYIRPSQPSQPAVPEDEQLDVPIAPGDDSSFRAAQAAELDPVLNLTEQDRRRNWLTVDADVRKTLRDLHVNFGHPTNVTLQRILRRQRARIDVIKAVDFMSCDVCGESLRRRRPKPMRLPGKYEFNNHLQVDVFYARDAAGTQFNFLNIICDATGFQVVSCLGQSQGPPASRAVLRHFLTTWSSWAGLPQSLQVDRGKEYLASFSEYLKEFGVEQEVMPLESPWKNGKVEKAGHLWKELFVKTVRAMQITGLEDVILATSIVTQTRNAFPRTSGYAPNQSYDFQVLFYKMANQSVLKFWKHVNSLAPSWQRPLAFEKLLVWPRSCKTLTAEFGELFYTKAHQPEVLTLLAAMSTSIDFKLLQVPTRPTDGLALHVWSVLSFVTKEDLKILNQQQKEDSLTLIGCAMEHQLCLFLENNFVLPAKMS